MKILALHLTNVRKFAGKRASITGIDRGITVVSEANEFGKSTFFDAIHALFFEKYSSSAKTVKSLQPYAGGAVLVAADVQTDAGDFRVEKRFLSKKSAKITRLSDNTIIAQEDEAERWISTLLGAAGEGPAGLLWVRQGLVGLEPDSPKEKSQLTETRRDLLSSVTGEIDTMTGGRRMDSVMRRVADTLSEIATKTGRKTGAWKVASDTVETLEAELAAVTTQVTTLEEALSARKQDESTLKRLDNPEANARRGDTHKRALAALEAAKAHAGMVMSARQDHDLADLKATSAQTGLDRFLKAISTLEVAKKVAKSRTADASDAAIESERCKAISTQAQTMHETAVHAVTEARQQFDALRQQIVARKAKAEAAHLARQIAKAEAALKDRDTARAIAKASAASPQWLREVEVAQDHAARLEAAAQAQATTLRMMYDGDARMTRDGDMVPDDQAVLLDGETQFDLPGIGQMTIHAQPVTEDGMARLAQANAALAKILSVTGASSLDEARAMAAARAQAKTKAELEQTRLDTLAPDGLDAVRAALADADLAASGANDKPLPDLGDLEQALAEAEPTEERARLALNTATADHAKARETAATQQAAAQSAAETLERARSEVGPPETQQARRADRLRDQATAQDALAKAKAALQKLIKTAPDLETAEAELERASGAVTAARQERTQVAERLAALSSQIRTLAGNGIEERRDMLIGQLEAARTTELRFARQAAGLIRLQEALNAERDAARETYFGPVQEELKPLLPILFPDATLGFDSDSLLPSSFERAGNSETLDDLSGGTQEQIAILTRLAFARLFARQGRHMPIVLDDALVYSDDDRIIKMFTALTRVAQDQQIIVFSCRQLAFQDLGGAQPLLEIVDA